MTFIPNLPRARSAGAVPVPVTDSRRRSLLFAGALAGLGAAGGIARPAFAQERFSLFVGSPQFTVERMVKIADLRDDDVVVDLGSGDGRIVLTAMKANPKVRGWGVDINAELVRQSNASAKEQGVADRAQFFHRNVFDADIRDVTVINLWLFPELMRLLRPKILAEARPGTRVISNGFDMGSWTPDVTDTEGGRVLVWIVPARVEGFWNWELPVAGTSLRYDAIIEQRFQMAEGIARVGNRRGVFTDVRLRGADLSFTLDITLEKGGLTRQEFTGRIDGDQINGTARVTLRDGGEKVETLPWSATRARNTGYFRPTGVAVK
jgi:hypothetical protein